MKKRKIEKTLLIHESEITALMYATNICIKYLDKEISKYKGANNTEDTQEYINTCEDDKRAQQEIHDKLLRSLA